MASARRLRTFRWQRASLVLLAVRRREPGCWRDSRRCSRPRRPWWRDRALGLATVLVVTAPVGPTALSLQRAGRARGETGTTRPDRHLTAAGRLQRAQGPVSG